MKQRILTAILALIVFIPFVVYGKWPFVLFVYVLATIGLNELLNMYFQKALSPIPYTLAFIFLWSLLWPTDSSLYVMFKVNVLIVFVLMLLTYTVLAKNTFNFSDASFLLFGTIYISLGFYFFIQARMSGLNYMLFILFIIWATDTGAYFFGNAFGKRKLWPTISPNKTIEGAIGGIVFAILTGVIFQFAHPFSLSIGMIIIISILIAIIGQIGDLVASAFKRHYDVKDSGNLLPGHGGILDRFDSLLFVLPFVHLIHFI